jgi:hypothetical protein
MYDGRVGRWMTTDPYSQYHSPYLAMGNNPIRMIDPDGGEAFGLTDIIVVNSKGEEINRYEMEGDDIIVNTLDIVDFVAPKEKPTSVKVAETSLAVMALDLSLLDPSDAVLWKWAGYTATSIVAVGVIYYHSTYDDAPSHPISIPIDEVGKDYPLRIALGLKHDLANFAIQTNSLPFGKWGSYLPEYSDGPSYAAAIFGLSQAFPSATFHFNLTTKKGGRLDSNLSINPNAVTTHEFIMTSTVLRNRTTYYKKSGSIYKQVKLLTE